MQQILWELAVCSQWRKQGSLLGRAMQGLLVISNLFAGWKPDFPVEAQDLCLAAVKGAAHE